jgi:hypothetical protein
VVGVGSGVGMVGMVGGRGRDREYGRAGAGREGREGRGRAGGGLEASLEQKVNIPVLFFGEYMLFLVQASLHWRWAISPAHEGISK